MSVVNLENLQNRSEEIKNETTAGANTASRVGSLLEDMAETYNNWISEARDNVASLDNSISGILGFYETFPGIEAYVSASVDDNNTGLVESAPMATIEGALEKYKNKTRNLKVYVNTEAVSLTFDGSNTFMRSLQISGQIYQALPNTDTITITGLDSVALSNISGRVILNNVRLAALTNTVLQGESEFTNAGYLYCNNITLRDVNAYVSLKD
jgi:hypothetical protein